MYEFKKILWRNIYESWCAWPVCKTENGNFILLYKISTWYKSTYKEFHNFSVKGKHWPQICSIMQSCNFYWKLGIQLVKSPETISFDSNLLTLMKKTDCHKLVRYTIYCWCVIFYFQLLARLTKLSWFDTHKSSLVFRTITDDVGKFLQVQICFLQGIFLSEQFPYIFDWWWFFCSIYMYSNV